MTKGAYINEDGKLVVDMAEVDKLWNSLSMEQQFQAMNAMFEPLLARATEMRECLEWIVQNAPDEATSKLASDVLRQTNA